jgi:hypothetical protein
MTTKSLLLSIVVIAGCGGDKVNHLPDAPNPPDAPPDAPPTGPVTLTVTSQGQPAAGVQVYFQNPDQSLVASPTTDASGNATATIEIGAFVTAIDPAAPVVATFGGGPVQSDSLHTWAGVKPGDHLHLDLFGTGPVLTNAAVTIVAPTDPMATSYFLYTSCNSGNFTDITPLPVGSGFAVVGNQPVAVNLTVCSATQDVLVVTLDAESQPVNSFFIPDVAISDDMTLDFTDQAYTAIDTTTLDFSNINVAITSIGITEAVLTTKGRLYLVTGSANVDGTAANTSIPIPAATNGVVVTVSDIVPSDVVSEQLVIDWGPRSAAYALDLSGALLDGYTTLPTFDPASHSVTWQEVSGVAPDLVVTQYHSFRIDATLSHDWVWTLAAPRAPPQLDSLSPAVGKYPKIPTDVFDFNTTATDTFDVKELINAKVPGGYDAARAQIMDVDLGDPTAVALGATGHAVVETVAPPPGLVHRHQRRRRH